MVRNRVASIQSNNARQVAASIVQAICKACRIDRCLGGARADMGPCHKGGIAGECDAANDKSR